MSLASSAAEQLHYLRRGSRLLYGFVRGRPVHCIVQVSNRCNLTCGFCSFWENPLPRHEELTVEDFQVISEKLALAGSMIVSIEGGEPLLRTDIVEIIEAFARHHHPIMFTNGWNVTAARAKLLWAAGLDTVGVSIDYPDAERHDTHRGKENTLDEARRAIDALVATAPGGGRQVFVMSVLMNDNADDMEALLELSKSHGVGHQITLISTLGDGRHDRAQNAPPVGSGARLLELKQRYPHFVSFSGYLEGIDGFLAGDAKAGCFAGQRFLNIDHRGDVSPCIEKIDRSVGNIVRDPWPVLANRLATLEGIRDCRQCLTSCRGFVDEMSGRPSLRSWREFFGDFSKAT